MVVYGEQTLMNTLPNGPRAVVLEEASPDPMMRWSDEEDGWISSEEQHTPAPSGDSSPELFDPPSSANSEPVITLSNCPDEFDDIKRLVKVCGFSHLLLTETEMEEVHTSDGWVEPRSVLQMRTTRCTQPSEVRDPRVPERVSIVLLIRRVLDSNPELYPPGRVSPECLTLLLGVAHTLELYPAGHNLVGSSHSPPPFGVPLPLWRFHLLLHNSVGSSTLPRCSSFPDPVLYYAVRGGTDMIEVIKARGSLKESVLEDSLHLEWEEIMSLIGVEEEEKSWEPPEPQVRPAYARPGLLRPRIPLIPLCDPVLAEDFRCGCVRSGMNFPCSVRLHARIQELINGEPDPLGFIRLPLNDPELDGRDPNSWRTSVSPVFVSYLLRLEDVLLRYEGGYA